MGGRDGMVSGWDLKSCHAEEFWVSSGGGQSTME